jgi:hypothetical protein
MNFLYKSTPISSFVQPGNSSVPNYNTITYLQSNSDYQKIDHNLLYSNNLNDIKSLSITGLTSSVETSNTSTGLIQVPTWANHYKFKLKSKDGQQ